MVVQTCQHMRRSLSEIAHEWDEIAHYRAHQILSGRDLSYEHVLKPAVVHLLSGVEEGPLLDVGCGTGFMTRELTKILHPVVGIDASSVSIQVAESFQPPSTNLSFQHATIEEFAASSRIRFRVAVANMVLMTMPDLDGSLQAISSVLRDGAAFVVTITHPCFWPRYWKYEQEHWFNYGNEVFIQSPFRISNDSQGAFWTTHIHRPLFKYCDSLIRAGFRIDNLLEPQPPGHIQGLYPQQWEFPRFLAIRCSKGTF